MQGGKDQGFREGGAIYWHKTCEWGSGESGAVDREELIRDRDRQALNQTM